MLIKFTEEQSMIRDMVRDFTEKEVAPRDKWMDENGFDWGVYNKLCETGLVGVHFPEEYGGAGCDACTTARPSRRRNTSPSPQRARYSRSA